MVAPNSIRMSEAYVELATRDDRFKQGLKNAERDLGVFAKNAAGIGGGSGLGAFAQAAGQERRSSGEAAAGRLLGSPERLIGAGLGAAGIEGAGIGILVTGVIAKAVKEATGEVIKLRDEFHEGKITSGQFADKLISTIPIFGEMYDSAKNIINLIMGWRDAEEDFKESAKAANEEMKASALERKAYTEAMLSLEKDITNEIEKRNIGNLKGAAKAEAEAKRVQRQDDEKAENEAAAKKAEIAKQSAKVLSNLDKGRRVGYRMIGEGESEEGKRIADQATHARIIETKRAAAETSKIDAQLAEAKKQHEITATEEIAKAKQKETADQQIADQKAAQEVSDDARKNAEEEAKDDAAIAKQAQKDQESEWADRDRQLALAKAAQSTAARAATFSGGGYAQNASAVMDAVEDRIKESNNWLRLIKSNTDQGITVK